MQILVISDIHANYPALQAVDDYFQHRSFECIINCGDALVYGPFPNETLSWLKAKHAISILGNTDKKVIKLLQGETFAKPSSPDKRIMYTWTAETVSEENVEYLCSMKKKDHVIVSSQYGATPHDYQIGIFHGSPARHHEFLFDTTLDSRFLELSTVTEAEIVVCGHSHVPFHKYIGDTHFINPGSVGRMFDSDPRCSCAVLHFNATGISIEHFRIPYDIEATIFGLAKTSLPRIYQEMFRYAKKTN